MADEIDDFFAEAYAAAEAVDQTDDSESPSEVDDVEVSETDVETDNLEEIESDSVESDSDEAGDDEVEDVWDWQQYADKTVPLQNPDGTTTLVTLAELRDGGLRQADYTRKTQEVSQVRKAAEWAQQVQAAMERDPLGTLQAFAQAYGITGKADPMEDLDEDVRPWAERTMQAESSVSRMEQRLQELEVERIKAEVRAEVEALKTIYADFDAPAAMQMSLEKGVSLEDAHLIISARRGQAQSKQQDAASKVASQAANKVRADVDARRQAAKKNASSTSNKSFRAADDIAADEFNTIDELFGLISAQGS